jgi:cellulose synthase/poly-beta-1,6-N-acetylglucosamine synthase-like glycosyltransferase/peptidoglycan/xylan/chitin deacetylase (PgdA/CDA1 family)/spore germination protein YaaH
MSKHSTTPIFYDPQHRRWRRFKHTSQALAAIFSIICAIFVASILVNPVLPSLGVAPARALPQLRHLAPPQPKQIPSHLERRFQRAKRRLAPYLAKTRHAVVSTATAAAPHTSELLGFYVNWDDTSLTSLKHNLARLDKLVPEWLHLASADGTVSIDDSAKQAQVLAYLRAHRPDLPITPLVNNFNAGGMAWEGTKLAAMLTNPATRTRVIQQILQFVRDNRLAGVNVDFENVPTSARAALKIFMYELYTQFHALGLEVSQSVPLDDPGFDYRGLAQWNDYLILMAYDEHWSSSKAGPIASQGWYTAALQRRFAELPPHKYVIALGNYGYDWKTQGHEATELSFQEALKTAQESEGTITLDPRALNPTFDYYDDHKTLHHVWFLNGVTAFNQLVEGQRRRPRGFALWRLGSEDPSIWPVLEQRTQLDRATAETLRVLRYGYDLDYEGHGEVLKVTATPADGARDITYDATSGLITAERPSAYASPYVITRWGGDSTPKIALTFDDGPDARYTPQVLDILHQYQVPATFFIVGLNGDLNAGLLQRIVEEGHEIGNHTFTHPNIATISRQQLLLEMNTTERLFESRLGRRSVLFRPPYAEDIEPETPDQVQPLLLTSDLGYYTIGMQIDPNDWRNPGVDQIVNATLDSAVHGAGHIVLLHDSGGDRSQTVAALPRIIEGLRAHGFTLVTVSDLLGLQRDTVMPPLSRQERLGARLTEVGFLLINWGNATIHYLFITGIVLGILRLLCIGALAVRERLSSRQVTCPPEFLPSVSVIVPAYNEEKVICQTIYSLLNSDYTNCTIIVVDDGSRDDTARRVRDSFGHDPRVCLFTKENGGKAQALNYGITQTQAEIVVTLDADTVFQRDTISKLVRHLADPQVGAVAGNAKVGNRINLLTNWQALEYITSQNMDRRAFTVLNCISVVPGAVGAWRRALVLQAGGFAEETLAEDADLTLAILRLGAKIDYEDEAIALTEAPDTVRAFVKQRFRWMYGTLQAAWKHRDTLFRRRYGMLGMVAIPNVLLFQIVFPLISPVMDLLMVGSLVATVWQRYQHPLDYTTDALQRVLFYYAFFLTLDFLTTFVAFLLERREDWSLLVWLFLQRFLYRQLMYYVAIKSTLTALRGTIVGWGKLERKATVAGGQL